jgi:hypothetical protein
VMLLAIKSKHYLSDLFTWQKSILKM